MPRRSGVALAVTWPIATSRSAYLTDRMADALVASDLVLGRAGSSTCAEVAAVGVASILVPYPYAGAHQRANAAFLADRGAAVMVPDAELDGERLLAEARGCATTRRAPRMAAAARALGLPHAADDDRRRAAGHGRGPAAAVAGRSRGLMGAPAGAAPAGPARRRWPPSRPGAAARMRRSRR